MTLAHETSAAKKNILSMSEAEIAAYQGKCGACLARLTRPRDSQVDRMSSLVILKSVWNKQELMFALRIESDKLLASLATAARKRTGLDIKTHKGIYFVKGVPTFSPKPCRPLQYKPVIYWEAKGLQEPAPEPRPAQQPLPLKPQEVKLPESKEPEQMPERVFEIPTPSPHRIKKHGYLRALAQLRENIMLTGPAGCGKTYAAEQVAADLKLPFCAQSFSEGVTEGMILGRLLPLADNGRFMYAPSAFVTLYETGGIFLFDELDAADDNTLVMLNNALAGDKFYLDVRPDRPIVKKHPDFVAIATANTLGLGGDNQYNARNQLDGATLDRFRTAVIPMDYDAELEQKIIDRNVLTWGREVRKVINERGMEHIMSTRTLVKATKQYTNKIPFDMTKAAYFADWAEDEMAMVPQALKPGRI